MAQLNRGAEFLNGVCRHEQMSHKAKPPEGFLNGVCRHELYA
ncbi:defensin-like peptide family protein [Acinetobacter baumannii 1419130]|nr:defensin-like peptide family protein [Acinetobacter baumannii 1419130]